MRSLTGDLRYLDDQRYGETNTRPKIFIRLYVRGQTCDLRYLDDQRYGESDTRPKVFRRLELKGSNARPKIFR